MGSRIAADRGLASVLMNSKGAEAVSGVTEPPSVDPTLQESLVATLPDLLFLLADTREQLEQARSDLAAAMVEVEAGEQAQTRLLGLVAGLQGDLKRISEENTELVDQLVAAGPYNRTREDRVDELEEECRRQTEAARQAGLQAATAEAQLREVRASRSWRMAEPLRWAGSWARGVGRGKPR
jgi:septal ring factor EnvC (AmiA/AmiB activator)